MKIIDIVGKEITVTNLNEAIKQADLFRQLRHEEAGYAKFDKQNKTYWQDIYNKLLLLKRKRPIPYFKNSYLKAKEKYNKINTQTADQRNNAMFHFGGHMRKGYVNRMKRTIDKVSNAASKSILRRTFYLVSELDICNQDDAFHTSVDQILSNCNLHKYRYDEYDFIKVSFPGVPVKRRLEAIAYFINTYGNKLDKKYLLPLIDF